MSHLVLVQRTFAAQGQADRYLDFLRPTAWPYVWCTQDPGSRRWNVKALVEQHQLPAVVADPDYRAG